MHDNQLDVVAVRPAEKATPTPVRAIMSLKSNWIASSATVTHFIPSVYSRHTFTHNTTKGTGLTAL